MSRHRKLLDQTVQLAKRSGHSFKLGCLLVQGSRIVSRGVNKRKSHPKAPVRSHRHSYGTLHAELDAILRCPYPQLQGATAYVARITRKKGKVAMAKPCPFCEELLFKAGVVRVYYTIAENEVGILYESS